MNSNSIKYPFPQIMRPCLNNYQKASYNYYQILEHKFVVTSIF